MVCEANITPQSTVADGGDPIIALMTDPRFIAITGQFFNQRSPDRANAQAYDLIGKRAPWVEAKLEDIGQVKEHTWDELYQFAINYQLRDPRLVVAILLLAKQTKLLQSYGLL